MRQLRQAEGGGESRRFGNAKGHIDRDILAIGVFDLGLGQCRTTVEAPVHRFEPAKDITTGHQSSEGADLVGLVAAGPGRVGVVPVTEHAQPDEVGLLAGDLLGGVGA